MVRGCASNGSRSCVGDAGANWNGSLNSKARRRRDNCCIGAGHEGGNECDEYVVHDKGTVQIMNEPSKHCRRSEKGEASGERQSSFQRVNLKGQTVAFDTSGMLEREDGGKGLRRKSGGHALKLI